MRTVRGPSIAILVFGFLLLNGGRAAAESTEFRNHLTVAYENLQRRAVALQQRVDADVAAYERLVFQYEKVPMSAGQTSPSYRIAVINKALRPIAYFPQADSVIQEAARSLFSNNSATPQEAQARIDGFKKLLQQRRARVWADVHAARWWTTWFVPEGPAALREKLADARKHALAASRWRSRLRGMTVHMEAIPRLGFSEPDYGMVLRTRDGQPVNSRAIDSPEIAREVRIWEQYNTRNGYSKESLQNSENWNVKVSQQRIREVVRTRVHNYRFLKEAQGIVLPTPAAAVSKTEPPRAAARETSPALRSTKIVAGHVAAAFGTGLAGNLIQQARERGLAGLDVRRAAKDLLTWDSLRTMGGSMVAGSVLATAAGFLPFPGVIGVVTRLAAGAAGAILGGQIAHSKNLPSWHELKRLPMTTLGVVIGTGAGMPGGMAGMFIGAIGGSFLGNWLADVTVGPSAPVLTARHPAPRDIDDTDLRNRGR